MLTYITINEAEVTTKGWNAGGDVVETLPIGTLVQVANITADGKFLVFANGNFIFASDAKIVETVNTPVIQQSVIPQSIFTTKNILIAIGTTIAISLFLKK